MKAEWKDPEECAPSINDGKSSVCVIVTPGDHMAQYPLKAWWNGDGKFYLASNGELAVVKGWDYYPEHIKY